MYRQRKGSESDLANRCQLFLTFYLAKPIIASLTFFMIEGKAGAKRTSEEVAPDVYEREQARRIFDDIQRCRGETAMSVKQVMDEVFADTKLVDRFGKGGIRYNAAVGQVARGVLFLLGQDPDAITPMTIGDVSLPPDAEEAMGEIDEAFFGHFREMRSRRGRGYELTAQGDSEARKLVLQYFDRHYGFSQVMGLMEAFCENSTVMPGGMMAILFIFIALTRQAAHGARPRIIMPDSSFDTAFKLADLVGCGGLVADRHIIETRQRDLLHLTADQVEKYYAQKSRRRYSPKKTSDIWYITPVGNPTGTAMSPSQLAEVCGAIAEKGNNPAIILDSVYVRTMRAARARALMEPVLRSGAVMDMTLFVESLSKSHGITGQRVGMLFGKNKPLYDAVQKTIITSTAGVGIDKSAQLKAVAQASPAQEVRTDELHEHWARERKGLYQYLIGAGRFANLFHEDQSHIRPEDLNEPMTLYLLVRLDDSFPWESDADREAAAKAVVCATGCQGQPVGSIKCGKFMRFSVGKLKEPRFAPVP